MACGTPVIITDTEGFWNPNNFKDGSELYLLPSDLNEWIVKINNLLETKKELNATAKNAKAKILNHYNTKLFNQNLMKILEI